MASSRCALFMHLRLWAPGAEEGGRGWPHGSQGAGQPREKYALTPGTGGYMFLL